jgi:hypothetical protein
VVINLFDFDGSRLTAHGSRLTAQLYHKFKIFSSNNLMFLIRHRVIFFFNLLRKGGKMNEKEFKKQLSSCILSQILDQMQKEKLIDCELRTSFEYHIENELCNSEKTGK